MATGTIKSNTWKEVGTFTSYDDTLTVPTCSEFLFVLKTEPQYGYRSLGTAVIPWSYFEQIPIGTDQNANGIIVMFDGTNGIAFPLRIGANTIKGGLVSTANGKTIVLYAR